MSKLSRVLLISALVAITVAAYIAFTGRAERQFHRAIESSLKSGSKTIDLSTEWPGDWELVCESHGYDGDLYLEKYKKTYPSIAPPQDGMWGLIFISADGSYSGAIGSCRTPGAQLRTNGCTPRSQAQLVLREGSQSCPEYTVRGG